MAVSRGAVGEWVRAGIIQPEQADRILRHARVNSPPTTWMDAAVSVGALAGAAVVAAAVALALTPEKGRGEGLLLALGALGLACTVLAVLLRRGDERASELGFTAALGLWLALAFADPVHSAWTALPAFAAAWALPFLSLRAETLLAAAVAQWPAAVFLQQALPEAGAPFSATEALLAAAALHLAVVGLALPRHGPWRQVPRAALVALGLVVAGAGLYALATSPSPRAWLGLLGGLGVAAGAAWLLQPTRAVFRDRFPQLDLDRLAPA